MRFTLTFLLCLTVPMVVFADIVHLKNGDVISGTLISKDETQLKVKTDYAGDLVIAIEAVREIITDTPQEIVLQDGSIEEGKRFKVSEKKPSNAYRLGNVAFINPPNSQKGGWDFKGNINAAMKFERGNNDTDEVDFDGKLEARSKRNRVIARGEYENDKSEDVKTTDKWKGSLQYDRFLNKRLFAGLGLTSERDRFADLENRTIGGPHIGYQFYENERMNLSSKVSANRVREEFKDGLTDYYYAAGTETSFDYYILMNALQFYHRHVALLNIDDTDKYLFDAYTGLRWPIAFGVVGSIEHTFEYDSEPATDANEYDHTYNAKLGYEW